MMARWTAANLFLKDITKLKNLLVFKLASPALIAASGNAREPYKELLKV